MKKLIVAVAITLCAIASQAATISWSVNNIQSSPDTAVSAGWLVEIYAASTAYDYAQAKAGTITSAYHDGAVASGTIFKANQSGVGSYAANESISLYAVVYDAATIADAKNYIISDVMTKSINSAGSPQTFSFGNMAGTTTTNFFKGKEWTATGATPTPEPTSAVLLLLGMAGLALRRKQA